MNNQALYDVVRNFYIQSRKVNNEWSIKHANKLFKCVPTSRMNETVDPLLLQSMQNILTQFWDNAIQQGDVDHDIIGPWINLHVDLKKHGWDTLHLATDCLVELSGIEFNSCSFR